MILETPRYVYEALAADVSNKEFLPLLTVIKPGAQIDALRWRSTHRCACPVRLASTSRS